MHIVSKLSAQASSQQADSPPKVFKSGLLQGLGAYLLWGLLPLYFLFLAPAGAIEIVAHRVIWSVVFCLLLILVTRSFSKLWKAIRDPQLLFTFMLAAILIGLNWGTYVWSIESHQAADAALGYFINPIVTALLAVIVLKEKLYPAQIIALILTGIAVVVIAVGFGRLPWVSIILAFSFGLYGLIKKRVGSKVTALVGMATETLVLFPVAIGYLVFLASTGQSVWASSGEIVPASWLMVLLMLSGLVTVIPLLLFSGAAQRLPLNTLGSLQYLAPILQLLLAVIVMKEPMPTSRWIGFILVWIGLAIIMADAVFRHHRSKALNV